MNDASPFRHQVWLLSVAILALVLALALLLLQERANGEPPSAADIRRPVASAPQETAPIQPAERTELPEEQPATF